MVPIGGIALGLSVASAAFACGNLLGTFTISGNGAGSATITSTGLDTLDPTDPLPAPATTPIPPIHPLVDQFTQPGVSAVACDVPAASPSVLGQSWGGKPYGDTTHPPCLGTFSFTQSGITSSGRAIAKSLLTGSAGTITIKTGVRAGVAGTRNATYLPDSVTMSPPCGNPLLTGIICPDDLHGVGDYDVNWTPQLGYNSHSNDQYGGIPLTGEPKCMNADRYNAAFHIARVTIGDGTAANRGLITAVSPVRPLGISPASTGPLLTQPAPTYTAATHEATITLPIPPSAPTLAASPFEAAICITDVHGQYGNIIPLTLA